jgi:hypothetical protein
MRQRIGSIMLLTAYLSSNQAIAESSFQLGGGIQHMANDPFLKQTGIDVVVDYRPQPHVVFEAKFAYMPDLAEGSWTGLTKQLVDENHISPDISTIQYSGMMSARIIAIEGQTEQFKTNIGMQCGIGLVQTADDLEALQAIDDPRAQATQIQMHTAATASIVGEAWRDDLGIQLAWDLVSYIETINSTTLQSKGMSFMTINILRSF